MIKFCNGYPISQSKEHVDLRREILSKNISTNSIGRKLTPEAHTQAVDYALEVFHGDIGNGKAAEIGIKHVTSKIFKND